MLPTFSILQDLARREPSYHCMSCNQWLGSNMEKVETFLEFTYFCADEL